MEVILIGDERVKKVPVRESGEAIVNLLESHASLAFDLERKNVQKESSTLFHSRKTVGDMLVKAQGHLPSGLKLMIKECYRPMSVQKKFWDGYAAYLRTQNPSWSEERISIENSKLNAPLDVAPHTTGGAVDLTLSDSNGQWLDMGTEFNASPHKTEGATFTDATNISLEAKANRKILVNALSSAGFVNYPTEWWHWSYGDKYWALLTGQAFAIYDSLEID
jgi:D-alanyl-D-alanine dipeptidase